MLAAVFGVTLGPTALKPAPSPAAGSNPVRIMALGDSITHGVGSKTASSYRVDLSHRLTAAGIAVDFVGSQRSGDVRSGADLEHEGHPGWRIQDISLKVVSWLGATRPDVVLLHIGTNDMRTDAAALGAAPRLATLINQITTTCPTAKVLVAKVVGAKDRRVGQIYQRRIDRYNTAVPAVVTAAGPNVHLVDMTRIDELDNLDTLHPNDFGYLKMAYQWHQALGPVLAGGLTWPAGSNPFQARAKKLRHYRPDGLIEERWWHLRHLTVMAKRTPVKTQRWQTQRLVKETYSYRAPAKHKTKWIKTNGRWTQRREQVRPARTMHRTRNVLRWRDS